MAERELCHCCKSHKERDKRCPHPAINGTHYCGHHQKCSVNYTPFEIAPQKIKPHPQVPSPVPSQVPHPHPHPLKMDSPTGFSLDEIEDDNIIDEICRQLETAGDYQSLGRLIQTNQRYKKVCSHYLKSEKKIRDLEEKDVIVLFVLTKIGTITWLDITQPISDQIDPMSLDRVILPRNKIYQLKINGDKLHSIDTNLKGPVTIRDLHHVCHGIFINNPMWILSSDFAFLQGRCCLSKCIKTKNVTYNITLQAC